MGGAYPAAEKPFLDSWRQHIGFFVDYTLGQATKDSAKVAKAKQTWRVTGPASGN